MAPVFMKNSLMPGGFIPRGIRSLLIVPVYLKDDTTDKYDDIGALVLMSSRPRVFQQDEIIITALVEIVSYHIWGNMKIAELEAKNKQVLEFERTLPKYDAAIIAATASAGTVHTARKYMYEISQAICNLAENKRIQSDRDLLNLTTRISRPFDELIKIYDRLLGVFRGIEPMYELCNIANLVQEVRDYLEPTLRERRISFRYIDKGIAKSKVKVDPLLMKVVLINIVRNSIEAAAREIVIEVQQGVITRWHADERDAIEILCKDNGIGIPEEDWERVFNLFYTANKNAGTGLGLAVNRNLLDKHEGEIQVLSSDIGKGTVISIKWPLDPYGTAT
jgi:two-component system sensor histidine kinase KdpD